MTLAVHRDRLYIRVVSLIGEFKLSGWFDDQAHRKFWDGVPFARKVRPSLNFGLATAQCIAWWNVNNDTNWYGHVLNDADYQSHGGKIIDDQYRRDVTGKFDVAINSLISPLSSAESRETFVRDNVTMHSTSMVLQMTDHEDAASVLIQLFERDQNRDTIISERFINSVNPGPYTVPVEVR